MEILLAQGQMPLTLSPERGRVRVRIEARKPFRFQAATRPNKPFWDFVSRQVGVQIADPTVEAHLEGTLGETILLTLKGGWGVNANWQNNHQRFDPPDYANYQVDSSGTPIAFTIPHGLYNLWSANAGFNTPNRALTFSANAGAGQGAIFAEAAEGRGVNTFLGLTWKPTNGLRIDGQWVHDRITRARDGSWFSTANIPRLKIEYQLNRDIFFRYVGQYFAQERDTLRDPGNGNPLIIGGNPQPRQSVTDFRNDFLFSYKPSPGTVFFFGYGSSLSEPNAFGFRDLRRTSDGFFLKASYLFRM